MSDREFFLHFVLKFFWPPAVLANFVDLIRVAMSDTGDKSSRDRESGRIESNRPLLRNATCYAVLYFAVLIFTMDRAREAGLEFLFLAAPLLWLSAVTTWRFLPESWFFDPGGNLAYSPKRSGLFRFTFYTVVFAAINVTEIVTGRWIGGYMLLLWIFPLVYVFPYLMLVRELFQHANADQGEVTNSRVISVNPIVRWALMGYGNDIHTVHHIYPNIPHYNLAEVHRELCENSSRYREEVEETHGTLGSSSDHPSLMSALSSWDGSAGTATGGRKR